MKRQRAQKRKMRRQMHYENRAHKQSHMYTAFICAKRNLHSRTVIKCVYSVQKLMHHHDQCAITVIKQASSSRLSFRHLPFHDGLVWSEFRTHTFFFDSLELRGEKSLDQIWNKFFSTRNLYNENYSE